MSLRHDGVRSQDRRHDSSPTIGLLPIRHRGPEVRACGDCKRVHAFHCGYEVGARVVMWFADEPEPEDNWPSVEEWDRIVDQKSQKDARRARSSFYIRVTPDDVVLIDRLSNGRVTGSKWVHEVLRQSERMKTLAPIDDVPARARTLFRIHVSLDDLDGIERLAQRHGMSRSEAFRAALHNTNKAGM